MLIGAGAFNMGSTPTGHASINAIFLYYLYKKALIDNIEINLERNLFLDDIFKTLDIMLL